MSQKLTLRAAVERLIRCSHAQLLVDTRLAPEPLLAEDTLDT